jgi:hypothetical protein
VIGRFGGHARQHDKLHAKVIWTRDGAIVGSANASSNGLPEEEQSAVGLIEAGVFIKEAAALSEIGRWFDIQYNSARRITKADLQSAKLERDRRVWNGTGGSRHPRRALLKALQEGGKQEFSQQRIAFALCKGFATTKEARTVKQFTKDNASKIEDTLKLPRQNLRHLSSYFGWSNLPTNTFLIACEIERDRISQIYVEKTFDFKKSWRIKGIDEQVTYVLQSGFKGFNYSLSREDKRVIRASLNGLWKKAKGTYDGKIIDIIEAAPILLSTLKDSRALTR